MEVFNVTGPGESHSHNVTSDTVNFQKDESSQSKSLAPPNYESSILTSYLSIKGSSGECSQLACIYSREVSGPGCFLDDSSSGAVSDPCNARAKQMKLSSLEQQTYMNVDQECGLSSTVDDLTDLSHSQSSLSVPMQHQQQSTCLCSTNSNQHALWLKLVVWVSYVVTISLKPKKKLMVMMTLLWMLIAKVKT